MRIFVIVIVLSVWAAVVLVRLYQTGDAPDPITWGIPGGIWVLLHPRKKSETETPAAPAEQEGTP